MSAVRILAAAESAIQEMIDKGDLEAVVELLAAWLPTIE
jgi:hypothetical protein